MTAITKDFTSVESSFRIVDFGGPKQVASPKSLEYLTFRTKDIVNTEISDTSDPPVRHTNFKKIIFSGDAPASKFKKIREAVIEAVPEFSDRFLENIEPDWVGAVGAARRAREYMLNPTVWDIDEQPPSLYEHDEL